MSLPPVDVDNRPHPKPKMYADNRERALKRMRDQGLKGACLVFGLQENIRPLSDCEGYFRNESCFLWLSGVDMPGCVLYIDISSGKTILFNPICPEEDIVWFGEVPTEEEYSKMYEIEFRDIQTLKEYIQSQNPPTIYSLDQTFRKELLEGINIPIDFVAFFRAVGEERQIKSSDELELMKYACNVNCNAFRDVLTKVRPGQWAHQTEALLEYHYLKSYCRQRAFATICCTGPLCSILHYHQNDRKVQNDEMMLVDAGCEYYGYASDNTRTIPANGKFTPDQRAVYQAVLNTQKAVIAMAKPGLYWPEVAYENAKIMAKDLQELGLFRKEFSIDEIIESGALAAFYPHGLGHGMGLDCHEIYGWPAGVERGSKPHHSFVRMGRTLKPGIVVTAEPGCYFCPRLYEAACKDPKTAKIIDHDVAVRLHNTVGGVRIEDDLLITEDGCINLSSIPKEIDEIEAIMQAAQKQQ